MEEDGFVDVALQFHVGAAGFYVKHIFLTGL